MLLDWLKCEIEKGRGSNNPLRRFLVTVKDWGRQAVSGPVTQENPERITKDSEGRTCISWMMLEVCSPCQNKCSFCTHAGLMACDPGYQMSLDELDEWIQCTLQSGYFIEQLFLNGPGEPTLWRHLNEGIKRINDSGAVGKIILTSNGLSLDRLNESSWRSLERVDVSYYPENPPDLAPYQSRVNVLNSGRFFRTPTKRHPGTTPCFCSCSGPMILNGRVFFYCGPPVFAAAEVLGVDLYSRGDLSAPIAAGYMEGFRHEKIGRLDLCEACWANANIYNGWERHSQR